MQNSSTLRQPGPLPAPMLGQAPQGCWCCDTLGSGAYPQLQATALSHDRNDSNVFPAGRDSNPFARRPRTPDGTPIPVESPVPRVAITQRPPAPSSGLEPRHQVGGKERKKVRQQLLQEEEERRRKEDGQEPAADADPRHILQREVEKLESEETKAATPPDESPFSIARYIKAVDVVKYPEGIQGPKPEPNGTAIPGHIRYHRDFLMQFMPVCHLKPPSLAPLGPLGLDPVDHASKPTSVGRGAGMRHSATPIGEGRFAMGDAASLVASANVGSNSRGGHRVRSKRPQRSIFAQLDRMQGYAQMDLQSMAPLKPLVNHLDRNVLNAADQDSPKFIHRKVKALLNKLTMDNFDSISDQIIACADKSEQEKDGHTLALVTQSIFEEASGDPVRSGIYARLCHKMMERISHGIQDDDINEDITGGQLFGRYLLQTSQDSDRVARVVNEVTARASALNAVKAANRSKEKGLEEVALKHLDEWEAAQKARHRGLGSTQFIGELVKLHVLPGRVALEYATTLLGDGDYPEEEGIEKFCMLLSTAGALLDTTPKVRDQISAYFFKTEKLAKSRKVTFRTRFMLEDLVELRERKWVPRISTTAPTTLARIHEIAMAEEKAASEKESLRRQTNRSRTLSRRNRGQNKLDQQSSGLGGRAAIGEISSPSGPPPEAVDHLTSSGSIGKDAMRFRPSNAFSRKKDPKRGEPNPRSDSNSNMHYQAGANAKGKSTSSG